ncbi:MAG: ATP-binding cassette domain-containing protein [Candidatus Bathyarchaeia archaeon]
MPIIEVEDLWWKYEGSDEWILKGIDLKIEKGEFLAITGPSGAGKTTLCMCLNGLIPHSNPGVIKGKVTVSGLNVRNNSPSELSEKVGMVFQDPESQFIGMSVEEEIVFGPENQGLSREEMKERLDWALRAVRMEDTLNKAPYELSGGQKQRVAIASALVMLPEILILDEPTSELDPVGKAEVFSVISDLRKNMEMTIMLVEHETEEIAQYADRVVLIEWGKIIIDEKPKEFFKQVNRLKKFGVDPPQVTELTSLLIHDGIFAGEPALTLEEAYEELSNLLKRRRGLSK